ncbi:MAG: Nramp family divalent metal transporter [Planctomycetaceae bacterium]|nr:Nramp family divalent metal transporter [Planctomycetaceae bacterium]
MTDKLPTAAANMPTQTLSPPKSFFGILSYLGPGLIIAASIVGSGELIATTLTGARGGLSLLWLIILGCVVKVFAQIEIGRFTVSTGIPTLSALNTVPGPRISGRGNWLVWYWFFMWFCSIGQLGGIVGSVGQVLSIVQPLTTQGADYKTIGNLETQIKLASVKSRSASPQEKEAMALESKNIQQQLDGLKRDYLAKYASGSGKSQSNEELVTSMSVAGLPRPMDDRYWAVPVAIITAALLFYGGYSLVQSASTAMVAIFTLVTLATVIGLQAKPDWSISASEWLQGLSFGLPEGDKLKALTTALATVGIIGVGAAELIQYPYWCIEKGYAKHTGPDDGSNAWLERARGWLKVMHYDIWVSMLIYTTATIGFFVLGAGILHRSGIQPEESKLIQTLSAMYEPVLGSWAPPIYLFGAFMVLYSTYYVANASHARTFTDGLSILNLVGRDQVSQGRMIKFLSALFPMLCLLVYWVLPSPAWLVLISGSAQAVMLPMLGFAALYFRYYKTRRELHGSKWIEIGLWISVALLFVIGLTNLYLEVSKFFK